MRRSFVVLAALVLGALAVLGTTAGPAVAEPPIEVEDQLTDQVAALNAEDRAQVATALSDLQAEAEIGLFVVFVSGFDVDADSDWAAETAALSDLDASDMLFAVDVDAGAYEWWTGDDFGLSPTEVEQLMTDDVQPLVVEEDYAGAVVALTEGLSPGSEPEAVAKVSSWSGTTTALVVVVVVVVLGGAHLLSRRRASVARSR